jgi:hypothetical protein
LLSARIALSPALVHVARQPNEIVELWAELRVAVAELERRVAGGERGAATPLWLAEAQRIESQLRRVVAQGDRCVTTVEAAGIRSTLDELHRVRRRMGAVASSGR